MDIYLGFRCVGRSIHVTRNLNYEYRRSCSVEDFIFHVNVAVNCKLLLMYLVKRRVLNKCLPPKTTVASGGLT